MRCAIISNILAVALLFFSVEAIITSLTAPATIAPGQYFTITLNTANYIQAVYDVSVAFGAQPSPGYPQELGEVFASAYLGPSRSNILAPISFPVLVSENTPKGSTILSAAVTSLFGTLAEPVVVILNVTVEVSNYTSSDTVTSPSLLA